jgi:PAS domain S-box-containing protein
MTQTPTDQKNSDSNHELERRLRETLERYELIFQATNDVLYELDLDSGKVIWNDALQTQYGYAKKDQSGTLEWWTEHVHPDDALRLQEAITAWFDSDEDTWQSEYRFRKADGSYVHVRDRGLVQRAADRTPRRVIGSYLDITNQKQLDRAKDEFISLVSHQLRTPLTAIRIYGEMLGSGMLGTLSDEQKTHIGQMTDASKRLIRLVGDILDISRVELGHVVNHPQPTDVNRLLQTLVDEIQPIVEEKNIKLLFESDSTIESAHVDSYILDQIVHNLLSNAVRYTKPRTGKIEVTLINDNDGHLLSVKDNGIGIPKTAHRYVFNRFYRADNTMNIKEQGTGLGLYMVKQMAETAGYDVWFESSAGKGTTFFVRIPPTAT